MANIKHTMQSKLHEKYRMGKGMKRADDPKNLYIHSTRTLDTYLDAVDHYAAWLKEHGIKSRCTEAEAAKHVQAYVDDLVQRGLSENTIHTYLSGVCKALDLKIADFEKPRRVSAAKKGRVDAPSMRNRSDADSSNPKFKRLTDFAACVGIRRSEYADLRGGDFEIIDGNAYVIVRRGKGGKLQRQLIAPENAAFVGSYFEGLAKDERVFSSAEMNNKINLHAYRREYAQNLYHSLVDRMERDPAYRDHLIRELRKAFERSGENWWRNKDMQRLDHLYHTRGNVRQQLQERGLPTSYDRVALMTVSVNNLAHWRANVTVRNYMM